MTRSHIDLMLNMLCDTNRIVAFLRCRPFENSMHLRWKVRSPTASTSSRNRISGSRCAATANANRTYMPLE